MKVIIPAAGEGVRLRPLTDSMPKCMVPLAGEALLIRQLAALCRAGLDDISIVLGYRSESVKAAVTNCRFFENPEYAATNMVHTLMCAQEVLEEGDDVLVAYSDIVYEPGVVSALLAAEPAPMRIACNSEWEKCWRLRLDNPLDDAETFKADRNGNVLELGRKAKSYAEIEGQYMGLFILDAAAAGMLPKLYRSWPDDEIFEGREKKKMFMTALLQNLLDAGVRGASVSVPGGWLEVDTLDDLRLYDGLQAKGMLASICRLEQG